MSFWLGLRHIKSVINSEMTDQGFPGGDFFLDYKDLVVTKVHSAVLLHLDLGTVVEKLIPCLRKTNNLKSIDQSLDSRPFEE